MIHQADLKGDAGDNGQGNSCEPESKPYEVGGLRGEGLLLLLEMLLGVGEVKILLVPRLSSCLCLSASKRSSVFCWLIPLTRTSRFGARFFFGQSFSS